MSLQELHLRALEEQVVNLTRDCHYLMSLLNTEGDIDWDNWEQGRRIKEDLERSKDFFAAREARRADKRISSVKPEPDRRIEDVVKQKRKTTEDTLKAAEYWRRVKAERKACEEELARLRQAEFNRQYYKGETLGFSDIFDELSSFRLF